MSEKLEINEKSYLMLLNKVLKHKDNDRELALDRYRKSDESMETNDHFMLLGKNSVSYLRLAADMSNDVLKIASELKSIIYKDKDEGAPASAEQTDSQMRAIIDLIKMQEEGAKTPNDIIEGTAKKETE